MQTRSDQAQAYRFVTRRIVSALLSGEPETTERPMRRFGLSFFGSAMLAAIIFAVVGVIGFLFPSGARLSDRAIVIERETGARYVYIDGRLHPALNFTSARLVLGSESPQIRTVSLRSLADYPRGPVVGIAGAPDPLPTRAALTDAAWRACSLRRSPGSADFITRLMIGSAPPGGQSLGDKAILVMRRASAGLSRSLIWRDRRLPVSQGSLTALGLAGVRPAEVTDALLAAIPPGTALEVPQIAGRGEPGRVVDGQRRTIGQVFRAAGQHYVLLDSGLSTVGEVMLSLLLASGDSAMEISATAATEARSTRAPRFDPPGFPSTMPEVLFRAGEPAMVCTASGAASTADLSNAIEVYDRRPAEPAIDSAASPTGRIGPDGVRLADQVLIPGGRAALVRTLPSPGDTTPNTTTYLVTDQGVRYALPRGDTVAVIAALGYAGVNPVPIPVYLLALLRIGPTLDPVAARRFVSEPVAPSGSPTPRPTSSSQRSD